MDSALIEEELLLWPSWSATGSVLSALALGLSSIASHYTKKAPEYQLPSAPKAEEPKELLKEWFTIEEMNEPGLVRGRKTTSIRQGRRQVQIYQMEDVAFSEYPFDGNKDTAVFAVMDGHAGKLVAEATKNLLPKHIKANINPDTNEINMVNVFAGLESELGTTGDGKFDCEGCTCTIAYLYRNKTDNLRYLQVGNVGDSSAFLSGKNNSATMITVDHKVSNPDEKERIRSDGVAIEDRHTRLPTIGLAVSRALGDFFAKEVKSGLSGLPYVPAPIQITTENNFLILASDGLWDIVSGSQAVEIASSSTSAEEATKNLIHTAITNADCQDNVTVTVVLLR